MHTPAPAGPPEPRSPLRRVCGARCVRRILLVTVLASVVFHWVLPWVFPLPPRLLEAPPPSLTLTDRHGTPLRSFLLDARCRTAPAALSEMPPDLIACVLAAEDSRFYEHGGIDYLALARALRDALRHGRAVSGASTLSQQLVKISAPPGPRTVWTKLRDMLTARHLEMTWSKEQILCAWLNRVDFGYLCQGAAAAAGHYFHKPLADLSLAECAALAGLPQAPVRHGRGLLCATAAGRASFQRRWMWVLDRMAALYPAEASRVATARSLPPVAVKKADGYAAGHITDLLSTPAPGLRERRTSLDLPLQKKCEEILAAELAVLATQHVTQGAVVVMENATGEIHALAGSADYTTAQTNGALAPRSAGSTLKPFTCALALEQGWYPGSILPDVPLTYAGSDRVLTPVNFDRQHRGPVSLRHALAGSLNVPAVGLLKSLGGPRPLCDLLTKCGITTLTEDPGHYGLGLTIGNAGVRLLDMVSAYAALARSGIWLPARLTPAAGEPEERRVLTASTAWLITDILSDNAARSGQFGTHSVLRMPFPCAVKTGTSSDFRDNWCLGYTARWTVGVWTGNFDGSPMNGVSGVAGAAPVFRRIMEYLHADGPPHWPAPPEELTRIVIDSRTGHRLLQPEKIPALHRQEEYCLTRYLPPTAGPQDYTADGRALLDPALYGPWFRSEANLRRHALALEPPSSPRAPRILSPIPGVTYHLDPELPGGGRRLPLRSDLPDDSAAWSCGTLPPPVSGILTLSPGEHTIQLVDTRTGAATSAMLTVK